MNRGRALDQPAHKVIKPAAGNLKVPASKRLLSEVHLLLAEYRRGIIQ